MTNEIVHLDATQEEDKVIAQANAGIDEKTNKLKGPAVECRTRRRRASSLRPSPST